MTRGTGRTISFGRTFATEGKREEWSLDDSTEDGRGEATTGDSCVRTRMKKWIESHPNFERLVLGCIDADFASKPYQIFVGKPLT